MQWSPVFGRVLIKLGTAKSAGQHLTNRASGWMDDLGFYLLFNSISVISGRWTDDDERLCAMEPRLQLKRSLPQAGSKFGLLDQ